MDLLNSDLGKTIVSGVAGQTSQDQNKTSDLLTMALPVLMQAMARNASTPEGSEGLLNALNNKHDGSILDNLEGLFTGGLDANILEDGSKILGDVLGNRQQGVQMALSQRSGIDANSVAQILKIATPLLLGLLGKQTRQQNVNSTNGLEGLLGGLLGGNSPQHQQSFLESILNANNDGSIVDDVAGMVLGGTKSKSGFGSLSGLLGGLFGKR